MHFLTSEGGRREIALFARYAKGFGLFCPSHAETGSLFADSRLLGDCVLGVLLAAGLKWDTGTDSEGKRNSTVADRNVYGLIENVRKLLKIPREQSFF